jgi:glycosyltransferase involved in cell wall biosynthesis
MSGPERERKRSKALVVTGMHRSGTSLVASVVAGMGVEMGRDLYPADLRNPKGYFEDTEFLAFQRQVLQACSPADGGHPDWGWTPEERLDRARFAAFRDTGRQLADSRSARFRTWGWKDPRTTLLLDFWDAILDDARYLLVYRFPWEVADSMQRTGEEVFLRHPEWAGRIWTFYNRHLLEFYRRHPDRCLLVSVNALPAGLPRLVDGIRGKLAIELRDGPAGGPFDPKLFRTGDLGDPIVGLAAATDPQAFQLLEQLDELADLRAPEGWAGARKRSFRFARRAAAASERPVAVSVIVPCCNDRDFLLDAVASVERHAPDDAELLIVNDGSTESRTLEILQSLRALGYAVLDQENRGLSAARNAGVRRARGRYLLPLDADNRIRHGFVQAAVARLDADPGIGVVYGDRELFGWRRGRVRVAEFDLRTILNSNYIDACAVFRTAVWNDCGGYDEGLSGLEDWDFWIGAAERGWRFHHLDEVAFDYRVRPGSLIEESLRPQVLERLLAHVHRKHRDLFATQLPWPLSRLPGAANTMYWRSKWFFRCRAWRRHRRELGRAPTAHPVPS